MLRALGAALAKDLRLLLRDRAALVFLTVAPIAVITVAGFSLATLYGDAPRGSAAYLLPLADEDGGEVGAAIRERLADERDVEARLVPDRDTAGAFLRARRAGAALVIPAGTSAAIRDGRSAELILLTDPVKYLEIANLRVLVEEIRHAVESAGRARAAEALAGARRAIDDLDHAVESARREIGARLGAARRDAEKRLASARERAERQLRDAVDAEAAKRTDELRARLGAELAPLRSYLAELESEKRAFADWIASVRRRAGKYAERIPSPPQPPAPPAAVSALAHEDVARLLDRLLPVRETPLPKIALPDLPPVPELADVVAAEVPRPPALRLPGELAIAERSATGAPRRINTFDQNVPGFSVTFVLLGMLLGVSLGLLDERDWGTLERLRAAPSPFAVPLVAKLLARFVVGIAQMVVLFAIGRAAFGISLGPEPWALLLPTTGIVFAGTAFGLVVAAVARSRESVLPVGSIVIVTMAAVGGCWWPIDLEPPWMRQAALAFPTTWAMAAFNDLMIRRQPAETVFGATGVLFGHGLVYLVTGLLLFGRRSVDRG